MGWYPGLSSVSTFVDFQASMHASGHGYGTCPAPCNNSARSSTTLSAEGAGCHTAVMGEECYGHVQWAMDYGIIFFSRWYPGLASTSSFEDFQASLHANSYGRCTQPCPALSAPSTTSSITTESPDTCHTAVESDECHGHVQWAMGMGIYNFPHWYPGLSPQSSFIEFQASMHMTGHGFATCPQPCFGLAGRNLADVTSQRRTAPSPGSMAELTMMIPVVTTLNSSTFEGDAHLVALMRAVGQTLLGLDAYEGTVMHIALSRGSAGIASNAAGAALVTFVVSVPTERASNLEVKTAGDVGQTFQSEGLSHDIVPASNRSMKSYLRISDMPHLVVAVVTSTIPEITLQPHVASDAAALTPAQPTTHQPPMLRGTTMPHAKSTSTTRSKPQPLDDGGALGGGVEASGAATRSSMVFASLVVVFALSS